MSSNKNNNPSCLSLESGIKLSKGVILECHNMLLNLRCLHSFDDRDVTNPGRFKDNKRINMWPLQTYARLKNLNKTFVTHTTS